MITTIELRTPIQAHGEERRAIELRDVTPADLTVCGYPIKGLPEGGGGPDPKVISALISRLGNIPPSSVNQMTMRDWNACMAVVLSFFGEREEGEPEGENDSSSARLTSPTSGNGTLGTH